MYFQDPTMTHNQTGCQKLGYDYLHKHTSYILWNCYININLNIDFYLRLVWHLLILSFLLILLITWALMFSRVCSLFYHFKFNLSNNETKGFSCQLELFFSCKVKNVCFVIYFVYKSFLMSFFCCQLELLF